MGPPRAADLVKAPVPPPVQPGESQRPRTALSAALGNRTAGSGFSLLRDAVCHGRSRPTDLAMKSWSPAERRESQPGRSAPSAVLRFRLVGAERLPAPRSRQTAQISDT